MASPSAWPETTSLIYSTSEATQARRTTAIWILTSVLAPQPWWGREAGQEPGVGCGLGGGREALTQPEGVGVQQTL